MQVYATGSGSTPNDARSVPLLSKPVRTDADGKFSITESIVCPAHDSQIYLLGTGGYADTASAPNSSIALMTLVGPCGQELAGPVQLNELTTIGTIWPLAPYMESATNISLNPVDPGAQSALLAVTKLVDIQAGTSPGLALASNEAVSLSTVYSLASILDRCIFSSGGTRADGSACGQLFDATASATAVPKDTASAALAIAQNPTTNVSGIFALTPPASVFKPILTIPPLDWTIHVMTVPALPVITPGSGSYSTGQTFSITESTPGSSIHYTLDGSTPTLLSPTYTGPFTLADSATIKAIANNGLLFSSLANSSATIVKGAQLTTTPSAVTLAPAGSIALKATVTNSTSDAVVWSLSPAVGWLTPQGLYTAPATIKAGQQVRVTATSTADPTKSSSTLITVVASVAPIPTYYVDAVTGKDTNSGRTPATAFASIARVNALALSPGDTVAFHAGQEWHETLTIERSGSAVLPITFTSFSTGATPIISAADLTPQWTSAGANLWQVPSRSNPGVPVFGGQAGIPMTSISALKNPGQFYWSGSALFVYSAGNPGAVVEVPQRSFAAVASGISYVTLSSIELRGALNNDVLLSCPVSGCTGWNFVSDIFNSSFSNSLYVLTSDAMNGVTLTVRASIFEGGGSSGVKFSGGIAASIVGNQFSNLCTLYNPNTGSLENTFCDAIYGFSGNGLSQAGTYVVGNQIQNIGTAQSKAIYGGGIHADTVVGWDVEQNTIQNTQAPGLNLEKGQGSVARYNVLIAAGYGLYQAGIVVRAGDGTTSYTASGNSLSQTVEYNTVAAGSYWGCNLQVSQNSGPVVMKRLVFQKNICAQGSTGQALYADSGTNDPSNTILGNNFGVANPWFIAFAGSFPGSYAAFDAAWGSSTGSIQGDPQFVDPPNGNFSLQPTSPAKGIGASP